MPILQIAAGVALAPVVAGVLIWAALWDEIDIPLGSYNCQ
jgi:hypothetical protein